MSDGITNESKNAAKNVTRPLDLRDREATSSWPQHRPRGHVIVTTVSSDAHTWNLVFIQLVLEQMGYRVTNLGACVPDDEVVEACMRLSPDLLVVSTVNGHGNIDGERLIRRIRAEATLYDLPVVIGGKLGIHGADDADSTRLMDAGFTAVFQDSNSLPAFKDHVGRLTSNMSSRLLEAKV